MAVLLLMAPSDISRKNQSNQCLENQGESCWKSGKAK